MILTIEAWMDGYDSEDQMNEAIREYLPECFNMTAAHLTIVEHPDTVKLKELQDAVMALEPFEHSFCTDINWDEKYEEECNPCNYCDTIISRDNHSNNCPVTKLRQVLKQMEVSDEHTR